MVRSYISERYNITRARGRARAADAATAAFSARKTTAIKKCFFIEKTVKSETKWLNSGDLKSLSTSWVSQFCSFYIFKWLNSSFKISAVTKQIRKVNKVVNKPNLLNILGSFSSIYKGIVVSLDLGFLTLFAPTEKWAAAMWHIQTERVVDSTTWSARTALELVCTTNVSSKQLFKPTKLSLSCLVCRACQARRACQPCSICRTLQTHRTCANPHQLKRDLRDHKTRNFDLPSHTLSQNFRIKHFVHLVACFKIAFSTINHWMTKLRIVR